MAKNKRKVILCSACLLGIKSKYDGGHNFDKKVVNLAKKEFLVPICPEQLGGLPTPRQATEIRGKRAITKSGKDLTRNFRKGAKEVLKLAKLFGAKQAILKQRSPSCGYGQIYDGSFSGRITKGDAITASLLKRNKIKITTEEDLK